MSKREQEKVAEQATKSVEVTTQQFQNTFQRSLDETKENVRKSIDETRSQIPRYTTAVKNYQEQALESTGKMVEEYVEAQKSVMDSVFSSAAAYHENATRIFNYWSATRITNDILYGNIGAFGSAFERAQQHTEELSRINVNNAKTIANTAKETAAEFSETFTIHKYKLC